LIPKAGGGVCVECHIPVCFGSCNDFIVRGEHAEQHERYKNDQSA
jgi:hypothetical protein